MAYLNNQSRAQRGPIIVAIGALHAGVIYALITGLGGIIPPVIEQKSFVGEQIPLPKLDPPATPEPSPQPQPRDALQPVPRPTETNLLLPRPQPTMAPDPGPSTGELGGDAILPLPLPKPLPSTEPTGTASPARPRGSPGLWVTTDDYPPGAIRSEREGVTRFSLSIGSDGKVRNCTIVASSGHSDLDRATCTKLTSRAKFKPATDVGGNPVSGTYAGAVRWKLPAGY